MLKLLRGVGLLLSTGGGAYGAFRALDYVAQYADPGAEFHLTQEALLMVIPVCLVGAVVGAVLGGMILPRVSH